MSKFNVFEHPTLGLSAVKEGFSWTAFFFLWIWAFTWKMWRHGIDLLGIVLLGALTFGLLEWNGVLPRALRYLAPFRLAPLSVVPPLSLFSVVGVGVGLWAGFKGNRWVAQHLRFSGYEYRGWTWAYNRDAALAKAATGELHAEVTDAESHELDRESGVA